MAQYFWDLLWGSIQDLPTAFGQTWLSLFVLSIVPIITWIIQKKNETGKWRGAMTFPGSWKDIKIPIVVWVLLLLTILAYNFVSRASFRDEAQKQRIAILEDKVAYAPVKDDASDKIITDLRLRLVDSERRNDKAETKLDELRRELEQTQGRLRDANVKLADKTNKAIIRAQLGEFLSKGNAIRRQCARRDYQDACLSNEWANEVKAFLSEKFDSSYMERFEHPDINPALGYVGSRERERSLLKLDGQIAFLKEVIKEQS